MVSWQKFVQLAFGVARQKGARFDGIEDGGDFLSQLSMLWDRNKDRLKQMTEAQANQYLQERIEA